MREITLEAKAENLKKVLSFVDEYLEKDNWVGEYMFHNCNALESVVLPASVTEICAESFQNCPALVLSAPAGSYAEEYIRTMIRT